jgi:hypothetical protein
MICTDPDPTFHEVLVPDAAFDQRSNEIVDRILCDNPGLNIVTVPKKRNSSKDKSHFYMARLIMVNTSTRLFILIITSPAF